MTNEEIVHNNLTYKLKHNKLFFESMPLEMRNKAESIEFSNFLALGFVKDEPKFIVPVHDAFIDGQVYRLRPDYEPPEDKAEVVECEPGLIDNELHVTRDDTQECYILTQCPADPDFVSFDSDGFLHGRLYKDKDTGEVVSVIRKDALGLYDVLPIDNVLFRSKTNEN